MILSCSQDEFDIENPNAADAKDVLAIPSDFQNFNITNHTSLFSSIVGFNGVYFRGLADQFTSTNAFRSFWDYCEQPRLAVNNQSTNGDLQFQAGGPWAEFNAVVNNANIVINNIENENGTVIIDEDNFTNQELASAYFDKGVAQGYLAMIYDKAYIVDPTTSLNDLQFSTYQEVLTAAVSNIEKAIQLASSSSSFSYEIYRGGDALDGSLFEKVANSFLARLSIGNPRTDSEAASLDYNKILQYANNGIDSDFFPTSKEDVLYSNLQDWSLFQLADGSGYMPTDLKILKLFDTSYETDYPLDSNIILGPANSTDPRLTSYYEYVDAFGFLNATRNRALFSNYRHTRYFNDNDENQNGLPVQIFPKAEIDYIKAECHLRLNDFASAVAALDASPRMTTGNQSTTPTAETVRNAIFYEYSIELDLASGMAVNWAFMRRHDLLQPGTPTMYPVPATELEITADTNYTFGGASNAGSEGAASGSKDWRTLTLTY